MENTARRKVIKEDVETKKAEKVGVDKEENACEERRLICLSGYFFSFHSVRIQN
jgi:hypothetical protein